MPDPISCDRHGSNTGTYVCRHVAAAKRDGPVDGFDAFIDEEGNWQAMCGACGDTMIGFKGDDEARDAFAGEVGRLICLDCFREAAAINGVEIP